MRPFPGLVAVLALAFGLASCKREESVPATSAPTKTASVERPIQIPGISISSVKGEDWLKQGHQVPIMTPVGNGTNSKAEMAVAWTPEALVVQVHTDDETPFVTATEPWNNDSIEVFIASSYSSDDRVRFICYPGWSTGQPSYEYTDLRVNPPLRVSPGIQVRGYGKGYIMTIVVPWINLKHIPLPGEVIGLQVSVNDAQGDDKISHRIWYPEPGADENSLLMQRVQLTGLADTPEEAVAWVQPKEMGEVVNVSAGAEAAGKKIEIFSDGKSIASGELMAGGPDGSSAEIQLPNEVTEKKGTQLVVTLDGSALPGTLKTQDLAQWRMNLLIKPPLWVDPKLYAWLIQSHK